MAESLEKPQIIIHLEKQLNYTVYDTKWIPCSAKFVALGSHPRNTGAVQIYELSKGELKLVSEVRNRRMCVCHSVCVCVCVLGRGVGGHCALNLKQQVKISAKSSSSVPSYHITISRMHLLLY